jgi:hypothetical protein
MTGGPSLVDGGERSKWLSIVGSDLPVDAAAMFPETHGFFATRANDRRAKLLAQLRPVLARALGPGEKVRYVARAVRYELGEFMFSGHLAAVYSNQMALVLTGERLLLLYIEQSGKPRDIKNQVRLTALCGAKRRGFGGYLRFQLADGKTMDFMSVSTVDRKVITAMLPLLPKEQRVAASTGPALEHLCPRCLKVVAGKAGEVRECPHAECRIPFRNAKKAALFSLLVPGIGDIYLRHFFFGALEYLSSLVALGVGLFFLMVAIFSSTAENWTIAAIVAALVIVGPRLIDYFITLHMGRKGLVPLANTPVRSTPPGFAAVAGPIEPRIPGFPAWVYAFLSGGALLLVTALVAAFPAVVSQGLIGRAQTEAAAGRLDAAHGLWLQAEAQGSVDVNERALLARNLYLAGDLIGGDEVLSKVGSADIEAEVAKELNATLAKLDEANKDYDAGVAALIQGQDATAWPAIDRALRTYHDIKRPVLPKTRDGVLVRIASEFLSAPLSDEDIETAQRFARKAGNQAPPGAMAVVQARLAAAHGKLADARAFLQGLDLGPLAFSAQLLALETRVAIDRSPAALQQIAADARKLPAAILTDNMQARRAALVALGGELSGIEPAVLTRAAEIAEAENWKEALGRLKAARPEAERP